MISNFYCGNQGLYGMPIKIYLAAEDPDSDMERVGVSVNYVSYGSYATDCSFLKPQFQKKFVGYLMWDTGGAMNLPEWTKITINLSVFDMAGNQSNSVILPSTFAWGGRPTNLTMPPVFNQGNVPRLGYVDVNLVNPMIPRPAL